MVLPDFQWSKSSVVPLYVLGFFRSQGENTFDGMCLGTFIPFYGLCIVCFTLSSTFYILNILSPTFSSSGPSVGPVFKGVKQFETASLEFDFQSYSLSYNVIRSPTHCLFGGCVKCA